MTAKDFDGDQILELKIRETQKESESNFELVKNITLMNGQTEKIEFDVSDTTLTVNSSGTVLAISLLKQIFR